nr:MAG TPA: hypothetical protein [Caudoviricetes sp.]
MYILAFAPPPAFPPFIVYLYSIRLLYTHLVYVRLLMRS